MNKKLVTALASLVAILLPSITLADVPQPRLPYLVTGSIWSVISGLLYVIWQIFIGGAIIMFILAGFDFFTAGGEPAKLHTARMNLMWGIVGLMVALLSFSMPYIISFTIGA